jgi:flagellar biosynthetic protein FliR
MAGWAAAEAGFGLTIGLAIAFLLEGMQLASQIFGLQAGYSYASTIDPNSQADSSVLQVIALLASSLFFFTLGLDREVLRVLAASLERFPAGTYIIHFKTAEAVIALGTGMFNVALRLAMPVVALLLLMDVALALLGRIQQQLQLLTLAFPLKMLGALAILAAIAPLLAKVFEGAGQRTMSALWRGF